MVAPCVQAPIYSHPKGGAGRRGGFHIKYDPHIFTSVWLSTIWGMSYLLFLLFGEVQKCAYTCFIWDSARLQTYSLELDKSRPDRDRFLPISCMHSTLPAIYAARIIHRGTLGHE